MSRLVLASALLVLAGCSSPSLRTSAPGAAPGAEAGAAPAVETLDPTPAAAPAAGARTVEEFDTTTDEDRAEAMAAPAATSSELGTTQATLGSPTEPGIWLKTPFVSEVTAGRIEYQGQSVNVELRPSGGAAGSGSQISLPAMRLIGAPLTDIVELAVFSG